MTANELAALGEDIAVAAATIDAAMHTLLTRIRVFDEHGGWHTAGAVSCAQWLSWRVGLAPGAARERLRVARALGALPLIDDALRTGRLSYSKVRAMTRVATPDNEETLVDIALDSTAAQLEKICRLYRQVGERSLEHEDRRWVTHRATDDGMVSITARLYPEEAAVVLQAIRVSAEPSDGTERVSGEADGLVAMSEAVVRGARPDRSPSEVLIRVDAANLSGDVGDDGVSAEVSRRILYDAGVVPVLEDGAGTVLDVGRKSRTVPAPIKRALIVRDRGCRFPGCHHTRYVDAHHVDHWYDGGVTRADNLVLLCRRHHRFVHEYGFKVRPTGDPGRFEFLCHDGTPAVDIPTRPFGVLLHPIAALTATLCKAGVAITASTNATGWDGIPVDYAAVVEALADADHVT